MVDFKAIRAGNDPRKYRLSDNFVLSDFLGNHSVYSQGIVNAFEFAGTNNFEMKLANVTTLCTELEIAMSNFGGVSIGYGYIAPATSRALVSYMNPDEPSHHRWDKGAAADVVFHDWVQGEKNSLPGDLWLIESARGSPIAVAHGIDLLQLPYSRMITYSESPYICLAVSAKEVLTNTPRKAFYENRYEGIAGAKPKYLTYANGTARTRALHSLMTQGLAQPWQGAGHPTYHGSKRPQYHHMRVSRYSMVSDFLFDLKSISNGWKNIPSLNLDSVQDGFAAAGLVYDRLCVTLGSPRLSVVQGYVSHTNPGFDPDNDWRSGWAKFVINLPTDAEASALIYAINTAKDGVIIDDGDVDDGFVQVNIDVNHVLENWE